MKIYLEVKIEQRQAASEVKNELNPNQNGLFEKRPRKFKLLISQKGVKGRFKKKISMPTSGFLASFKTP